MAITFQITDGNDTVDFHDLTNLRLSSAFQMNVGDGPVTEGVICGWVSSVDADAKAVITKRFNRLIRKSILHYREQRIDRAVWLVWKPDDQTDTQYAKVMGGGEVEVTKFTIGGYGGGVFNPTIIREGAWRSVAPDGTAGESVVSAVTVYNKSDADGDNWVSIASRTNDAPALLQITIDHSPSSDMLIAMKRGSTSFLNRFNPHFNPTDQSSAHSTTADTIAPGDFRIDLTADNTITWDILAADVAAYAGAHLVYVVNYQSSGAGSVQARFTSTFVSGSYVDVSSSVSDDILYLGRFNLPGTAINPHVTAATGDDLSIGVQYDITGTATVAHYGLFLVPVDIPPMKLDMTGTLTSTNEIYIDGATETSYLVNASGESQYTDGQVQTRGRYFRSIGGDVNRIYFYWWRSETNYGHNDTAVIDITAIDRFLGLRGNT